MRKYSKIFLVFICLTTLFFTFNLNFKLSKASTNVTKNTLKEALEGLNGNNSLNVQSNEEIEEDAVVRVIIQLEEKASLDNNKSEEEVISGQEHIIKKIEGLTNSKVVLRFGYLVNGFSIDMKRSLIDEVRNISGVKSVEEVIEKEVSQTFAKDIINATTTWEEYGYKGEGLVISIIDTGLDYTHKDFQNIDSSKIKLSEEKVNSIISNDIQRGKYYSNKVPFGYDYGNLQEGIIGSNVHGTHVSGIAGANGSDEEEEVYKAIKGVAPEAQLLAMKASFEAEDGNSYFIDDAVILAIEDSVKLGADIINMSFGARCDYREEGDLLKEAIEKATDLGVICVNAAGNDGRSFENYFMKDNLINDTSTINNPSNSLFTVANMESDKIICKNYENGEIEVEDNYYAREINYYSSWGPNVDLELKPEITAPGGNIYSTSFNNEYELMGGTSMASPNISGGLALIIQGLRENNINLSGRELVTFLKNTCMNTSEPLINKNTNIIYSPRQQGAGVMNIKNAIKNTVIATDDNGKASLALKSIGNTTSFNINLKNYSSEDKTYNLEDVKLYTEKLINNESIETEIEGAYITFDKTSVKVSGNSTEVIKGILTIPEDFKLQSYVEGYIKLSAQDEEDISISIPLLAFYGDWSSELIVDNSIYSGKSLTNGTAILQENYDYSKKYCGAYIDENTGEIKINLKELAFSPNEDGSKDYIIINTFNLRNSKLMEYSMVNNNTNEEHIITSMKNIRKDSCMYWDNSNISGSALYFSGYIFNENYDMYRLQDGDYTIKIKAYSYVDGKEPQITEMPLIVDTVCPTGEVLSLDKVNENSNEYEVIWNASDELSGLINNAVIAINGEEIYSFEDIKESNGEYKEVINYEGEVDSISLAMSDYAGNILYKDYSVTGQVPKEDIGSDTPVQQATKTPVSNISGTSSNKVITAKVSNTGDNNNSINFILIMISSLVIIKLCLSKKDKIS